ncbi:hypothetical protein FI667_g5532, partial [Globisporangium splendens]
MTGIDAETAALPKARILRTPDLLPDQTFVPKVQSERQHGPKSDGVGAAFVPGMNSVPSSFNKAKPRVYRSRFDPTDTGKRQTRCNVITTGGSADDDNAQPRPHTVFSDHHAISGKSGYRVFSGLQEKVSVVSLAELEDEAILMLDFRASTTRRRRSFGMSAKGSPERASKKERSGHGLDFLAWTVLSGPQRRIELMAASKSRCVHEDAERDEIRVPLLEDFDSSDMKVQLSINAFTRWFAASHKHRQVIRERFLEEELAFAATDPVILSEMESKGTSPVPSQYVSVSSSTEWQDFVFWYSCGKLSHIVGKPGEVSLFKERIEARGEYRRQRLSVTEHLEKKLKEDESDQGGEACPQRVFIFENIELKSTGDTEDVLSWEHTSLENREKEIALALLDPDIHIAAMTHEIELPDLSGASLDDFDLLALAGKFVPWWKAAGNKSRQDFLNQEVEEAAADKSIREMLAQELGDQDGTELTSENFLNAYFKSSQARLTFLKRKSRVASVAKYGKSPAPVVFETLPQPLAVAFKFPEIEIPATEDVSESEEVAQGENSEISRSREEMSIVGNSGDAVDGTSTNRIQDEDESVRIAMELELMAAEDGLSREYNAQMVEVESDDEDTGKSITPPKRTDFSRSHFFGNLPQCFRLPPSGWQSGSGIDNGDEETEEEEKLERERERQRKLEEEEAERLAEELRRAERARIEKEKEERAFQMRRVRQAELKKVLIYQAELEAQRSEEIEMKRMLDEARLMLNEEESERKRLKDLEREQSEMKREDECAFQQRKELRESRAKLQRQLLSEQSLMYAEDRWSAIAEKEHQLRAREEEERRLHLTELYTSFEPFFASTNVPSEDFLPSIQRRCQERQRRRQTRLKTAPYTLSFAETLVLDEVEQEPYLARDSRKFKILMGLLVRTSQGTRTANAPTESDIVRLQRKQAACEFDDGDRVEEPVSLPPSSSPLPALTPQRLRHKSRGERANQRKLLLPDLVAWKESREMLTDLNQVSHTQDTKKSQNKSKTSESSDSQRPPQAALPFFRRNMVVRGESKPTRAKDYSYPSR